MAFTSSFAKCCGVKQKHSQGEGKEQVLAKVYIQELQFPCHQPFET
jgi:hypothetical protein